PDASPSPTPPTPRPTNPTPARRTSPERCARTTAKPARQRSLPLRRAALQTCPACRTSLRSVLCERPARAVIDRTAEVQQQPGETFRGTWLDVPPLWHRWAMRGIGQSLTIGERVAWYRRRRGMSQEVLAG